jgi:hypothetical protein
MRPCADIAEGNAARGAGIRLYAPTVGPDGTPEEVDEAVAEQLAADTARVAARLAFSIEPHRTRGRFALAGAPVSVVFERAADRRARPRHRSGRLAPELLPFLVDATMRTRERLQLGEGEDNPYLIALVLAAFYVVDAPRTGLLGPAVRADQTPAVSAVAEAEALMDLAGAPGTVALRVIAPVEDEDGREVNAAVELRWSDRP